MCKIAINTSKDYIGNKNVDYRIYLSFLIESYFDKDKSDFRYISINKYYMNKDNIRIKYLKLKENSFNKILRKSFSSGLVYIEDDTIVIKSKEEGKDFVLVSKSTIEELLTCSSNEIKAYLVINYSLQGSKERDIELEYIARCLGLSETNTSTTIKRILTKLKKKGLIDFNTYLVPTGEKMIKRYKFFKV